MKVMVDSSPLKGGHAIRGVGFYTKNLIQALEKYNILRDKNPDIIHYPYFDLFFNTLPFKKSKKTVVTIHDVIPLLYQKHYPPGIKGKINFLLQKYSLKSVDAIITDTETSKKDIVRFLNVPPEKIHIINLAPAPHFRSLKNGTWKLEIKKRYNLPDRFVLYVGDINYNKNLLNLIKASKLAKLHLVIIGKSAKELLDNSLSTSHSENKHFKALKKALQLNKVKCLGFVPDEDIVMLYNLATVYCQPSLYEGFGLPPLEANACGCPVVINKTQALVEVCESFAEIVDAKNPKILAKKLLAARYTKNQKKYSWEKTARETYEVYKRI